MPDELNLGRFERRVRVAAAWRGAAQGLVVGSLVACAIVAVGRLQGHAVPWPYATIAVVACLGAGIVVGALRRIRQLDLADSLDRRAGLKNRVASALGETPAESDGLISDLREDAARRLDSLPPARVFPIRFGRLQGLAALLVLGAAVVTLLGNRPIELSPAQKAKAADNADAAAAVERVLSPYKEPKPADVPGKLEKAQVSEMEKLARDLNSNEIDREKALQEANKAEQDAKKLEQESAQRARADLAKAETASEALARNGQPSDKSDPAAQMSAELSSSQASLQHQIDELKKRADEPGGNKASLQNEISKLKAELGSLRHGQGMGQASAALSQALQNRNLRGLQDALHMDSPPSSGGAMDPLAEFKALRLRFLASVQAEIANIKERLKTATGAEAERLRKKLAELEGQLEAMKQEVEAYNKALKAALKAAKAGKAAPPPKPSGPMLHTKFNKPMQTALAKLIQSLNKIESGDDLSADESEALKKIGRQMEVEAAKAEASGDKERAMTASVLADAAKALADGNAAVAIAKACRNCLGGGIGGPSPAMLQQGGGGIDLVSTKDEHNVHKVNHLDKPAAGQGKTTPTVVDPLKGEGPESYIEIRGPASLGARSAIPYRSVLPSYQRKEERALKGGKIPKKHQQRVRDYFNSLNGR